MKTKEEIERRIKTAQAMKSDGQGVLAGFFSDEELDFGIVELQWVLGEFE